MKIKRFYIQPEGPKAVATHASIPQIDTDLVDRLAALIREVDGNHSLGAGALAEALVARGVTIKKENV